MQIVGLIIYTSRSIARCNNENNPNNVSGFQHGANEIYFLLEYYIAFVGSCFTDMQEHPFDLNVKGEG